MNIYDERKKSINVGDIIVIDYENKETYHMIINFYDDVHNNYIGVVELSTGNVWAKGKTMSLLIDKLNNNIKTKIKEIISSKSITMYIKD